MSHSGNWGTLLLLMLLGALIFAYLGELITAYVPALARWGTGSMIGIPALSLNLAVVKLALAFQFKLNLFTVLGLLLGLFTYRRL